VRARRRGLVARAVSAALGVAWELPQTALGAANLVLHAVAGNVSRVARREGRVLVRLAGDGAVSLGHFVFYVEHDGRWVPTGLENQAHEWGHTRQSRRLGPLYVPLVGVPSVLRVAWAIGHRTITGRRWARYYDGWPEKQADRLGRVDRSLRPRP
jgi:hypothetical protein